MRVAAALVLVSGLACHQQTQAAPAGSVFANAEIYWAAIDSVRVLDLGQYVPRDTVRISAGIQSWPLGMVGDTETGVPINTSGPVPFWLVTVARNHGVEPILIPPAALRRGPGKGARIRPVLILGPIQYLSTDEATVTLAITDADWRPETLYTVWVKRGSKNWTAIRVGKELQS